MANVTIHLQNETKRWLAEKATAGGQTLETYVEQLVEHHVRAGSGMNDGGAEMDQDELAERPWRGVFVPPRQRDILFRPAVSLRLDQLPKRQPSVNLTWHRMVTDDE